MQGYPAIIRPAMTLPKNISAKNLKPVEMQNKDQLLGD